MNDNLVSKLTTNGATLSFKIPQTILAHVGFGKQFAINDKKKFYENAITKAYLSQVYFTNAIYRPPKSAPFAIWNLKPLNML